MTYHASSDVYSGKIIRQLEKQITELQQALEAQHRKTWDMAINEVFGVVNRSELQGLAKTQLYAALSSLPCPPLTNESK